MATLASVTAILILIDFARLSSISFTMNFWDNTFPSHISILR